MGASGRVDSVFREEGGGGPESLAVLGYSRDRKGVRAVSDRGFTVGKAGGSGLGLTHAKESVELWGGLMRIESELGKGTTVELRLSGGE